MKKTNQQANQLFGYDVSIEFLDYNNDDSQVTIYCHGAGSSKDAGYGIQHKLQTPLITFNQPDYKWPDRKKVEETTFGTIQELLPLLFVLKQCVDNGVQQINLYGFSAGGGKIINVIALLNNERYEKELHALGITPDYKKRLLSLIQRGFIILDCPLKSLRELLDARPHEKFMEPMVEKFEQNKLEPINNLHYLNNLKLSILVHFQMPDEILSNRDDALYFEKLKAANERGITQLIVGFDGGHLSGSATLWKAYPNFKKTLSS